MPYGSSGDVYVLADEYGRVLVQHVEDGDYYQCVAWVDGETRFDFDSASDTELVDLMKNRGFIEGLTIGENLDVTVNIGRLTETYVWDAEKAEFDYDFDSWVNGSRTLTTKWFAKSDGTPELVVVNSADEKPVYFYVGGAGTQRCLVVNYPGDEEQYFGLDLASEHPELTSWHSVDCYESTAPGEGMATLNIVNFGSDDNIFVITINEDGVYREGSARLPQPPVPVPIPIEGAVQVFKDPFCSEYVTSGSYQAVYVRLNRAFGYGDKVKYGNPGVAGSSLVVYTPTDEDPSDTYMVEAYVDFQNASTQEPFEARQVIKCTSGSLVSVTNPLTVFGEL